MSPKQSRAEPKARWYDDACGTAHGLELLGERWALLVVRELMFGPRRFGELRAGLPGISANVLTQRLEGLEAAGVVMRREQPASAYELTAWGYEAEPVIRELGRWAARSPQHDPTLPLSPASLMLSFRTMLDRSRVRDFEATVGLRLADDTFVAQVHDGELTIRRGPLLGTEVVITASPMALVAVVYGGRSLAEAADVNIEGSRAIAKRFLGLFSLPTKVKVSAGAGPGG